MVDNMEEKHPVVRKTEEAVHSLLGPPTRRAASGSCHEYHIRHTMIGPITYNIYFENGVAIRSETIIH